MLDYDAGKRARGQYRKREAKAALQKACVSQLKQITWSASGKAALSRGQIAALMGISHQEYARLARPAGPIQTTPPLGKSPALVAAVHEIIRDVGLPSLTASKARARLIEADFAPVPSVSTLQRLLRETFGLSYRQFNSANLRFSQRLYDPKRIMICRYLGQLLLDDALLVCIDESAFSTRQTTRWRWQPKHSSVRDQMREEARFCEAQRWRRVVAGPAEESDEVPAEELSAGGYSDLDVADERLPGSPLTRPPAVSECLSTPLVQRFGRLALGSPLTPIADPDLLWEPDQLSDVQLASVSSGSPPRPGRRRRRLLGCKAGAWATARRRTTTSRS